MRTILTIESNSFHLSHLNNHVRRRTLEKSQRILLLFEYSLLCRCHFFESPYNETDRHNTDNYAHQTHPHNVLCHRKPKNSNTVVCDWRMLHRRNCTSARQTLKLFFSTGYPLIVVNDLE